MPHGAIIMWHIATCAFVVCAHIRKRGAVVGGFEAEFWVGLVFAGVEGTEFAETNGVGH